MYNPLVILFIVSVTKILYFVLELQDFVLELSWNFVKKNVVDTLSQEIRKY